MRTVIHLGYGIFVVDELGADKLTDVTRSDENLMVFLEIESVTRFSRSA
jgi:hypothetical protein